jgi:hypothetical protein
MKPVLKNWTCGIQSRFTGDVPLEQGYNITLPSTQSVHLPSGFLWDIMFDPVARCLLKGR